MEHVILVNDNDEPVGTMEKMEAHRTGKLHRAFSVILLNEAGQILLQKRSSSKYHSAGLWTNTCCSHPRPGEATDEAVQRRLWEELGIDFKPVFVYKFKYRIHLTESLIEHEIDSVYSGIYPGTMRVNPEEVEDWKFVKPDDLLLDIHENPDQYTHWFKLIVSHKEFQRIVACRE